MDFIIKLIVIVIVCIISFVLSHQRFLNLKVLVHGIIGIFGIIISFACMGLSIVILNRFDGDALIIMVFLVFSILLLAITLLVKEHILCAVRVIEYYIYKKRILENGQKQIGKIIEIKKIGFHRYDSAYYLVVDLNGKKMYSLCFLNNIHRIGDKIEVYLYKNHYYIAI